MRISTRLARFVAFAVAAALSWSLGATCAQGAVSTPSAQMACCKNGHHGCDHHGSPAGCCKTATRAAQFTAVGKFSPLDPPQMVAVVFDSILTTLHGPWHPDAVSGTGSPPGTALPTYLHLSVLRI